MGFPKIFLTSGMFSCYTPIFSTFNSGFSKKYVGGFKPYSRICGTSSFGIDFYTSISQMDRVSRACGLFFSQRFFLHRWYLHAKIFLRFFLVIKKNVSVLFNYQIFAKFPIYRRANIWTEHNKWSLEIWLIFINTPTKSCACVHVHAFVHLFSLVDFDCWRCCWMVEIVLSFGIFQLFNWVHCTQRRKNSASPRAQKYTIISTSRLDSIERGKLK